MRDAGSTAVLIGRLLFSLCSVVIGLFLRQCGSANEITHAGNGECQESTFWRICQPGIDDAFSDPYDIRRRPSQSFRDLRRAAHAFCVCSIESGPCERVDVFHVSGRFWSTSACGEKRTPARPAWTSFPS